MMIKLTIRLFALLLVLFVASFLPEITVASASNFFSSTQVTFAQASGDTKNKITFSEDDLTPQEHQKLQAVRQRRNKEILSVLDSSQRQQLAHELHTGSDLNQAIEALDLASEQQELINAVIEFTNLKLKGIFSHHLLLEGVK